MKFPLHLLLTASAPLSASAYLPAPPRLSHRRRPPTRLHYKEPSASDGKSGDPSERGGSPDDASSVWSVLASTERWISDTLDRSNQAARDHRAASEEAKKKKLHFADEKKEKREEPPRVDNPYARKEVSYVCETGTDLSVVVGSVFRRVREARELGENHGRGIEARAEGSTSKPTTIRQTNVVVIPNCEDISEFAVFDKLVQSINQARRASRDFVLKKKEEADASKDWVVSINCAHLHPQYGELTPSEQLAALKREEEEGEVDVNLQEYKKRRDEARRSPYPSVIVEVMSMPSPDFGAKRDEAAMNAATRDMAKDNVTSEDVRKLEALFGMSAAKKMGSVDDPFYDALGEAFGKKQIASQTPLSMAQNWVLGNDPAFQSETSTFTKSSTRHVDAAYEYVFNNLAMLSAVSPGGGGPRPGQKSYVVFPNLAPTSAASFDRFAGQVSNIAKAMPNLAEKVMMSTFHPEHVVASTRSPVPIFVITWK